MRLLNEFLIAHMFLLVSSVGAIIMLILTSMLVIVLSRRTDKK